MRSGFESFRFHLSSLGKSASLSLRFTVWIKRGDHYMCKLHRGALPHRRYSINITSSLVANFLCRKVSLPGSEKRTVFPNLATQPALNCPALPVEKSPGQLSEDVCCQKTGFQALLPRWSPLFCSPSYSKTQGDKLTQN